MTVRRIWLALLWGWIATLWLLSTAHLNTPAIPSGDKIGHFAAYSLLAWLATNLGWNRVRIWIGASLMGVGVECVQYFLPWRSFEFLDMVANSTGALLGIILASTAVGSLLPRLEHWKKQ